jgi:sortase (surface protein transpeptidase)
MLAPLLAACANGEPRNAGAAAFPPTETPAPLPSVQPSATAFQLDALVESNLDLWAGPVEVPLVLEIPALGVTAPVLGVGLTPENLMDSPRGPLGDPIWSAAYWYRGGGIPGSPGTATIAGHVNDPLGEPEIFARLQELAPGDLIIIQLKHTTLDIRFTVDETRVYSVEESSKPAVLERIFGAGPVAGIEPLPSPDGLSHLTLITCAGYIRNGTFDHHTVVFATRSN